MEACVLILHKVAHVRQHERKTAVGHRLHLGGHSEEIQRKALDNDIRSPDLLVDILHVVFQHAASGSAAPAGKAAAAGLDVLFIEVHLLDLGSLRESLQERPGDIQCVAALRFGTSVKY